MSDCGLREQIRFIDPERLSAILTELAEWAALGFYEGSDLSWPRNYGLAYRRLYENMEIVLDPNRFLVPCEPLPRSWTRESHQTWFATSMICDPNHNSGLRINQGIVEKKKKDFPQHASFIDELVADLTRRLPCFGGYTHCNPDIRRVVGEGFDAMEAELDMEICNIEIQIKKGSESDIQITRINEELQLLLALKDYAVGVRSFHQRIGDALENEVRNSIGERKQNLDRIRTAWKSAFLKPAATFMEGVLAVNMAWMLDFCDSIGRFDQVLGPLFERDLADGVLDLPIARRILDEVWQSFERFNGWNLQIGGYTPEGQDGCNLLTRECIEACRRNHLRRPNVAFRVTRKTPDDILQLALGVLADGSGRPALYNDDLYIDTLCSMDLGLAREDARDLGFGGCTETMIAGMSNVGSLDGYIDLARCLSLAIHDGFNPMTRKQEGPHTGTFETFISYEMFITAVKRQITAATDMMIGNLKTGLARRFREGDPKLYRTFFTRDCVKNHKSFEAGGPRYNWSVISYHGIANLIDSLYSVKTLIYDRKTVNAHELLNALNQNYEGYDWLLDQIRNLLKFGNDLDEVDLPGQSMIRFAWNELYSHETPRGGRFLPSCILFVTYFGAGLQVPATPDGRKAGEVLTDSVGPAQGRDSHGPTSMLNSVSKLPLSMAAGTPVLNLKLARTMLVDPKSLMKTIQLVRGFFASGGMQLQISVADRNVLLDAQKHPDKHQNLIVRIGGYSEKFTTLGKELQDSVIARTEHGI